MRNLARLLEDRLASDPAAPFLTFYDDATGERIELSGTTLANWVAKSANLLVDAHGLASGDRVAIVLPTHWQTAVLLLAAWRVGVTVVIYDPSAAPRDLDAQVGFVEPAAVGAGVRAEETYVLALRPLGGRFADPPGEVLDFAVEVPGQGDYFSGPYPHSTGHALVIDDVAYSADDLMTAVTAAAAEAGGRVLTDLPYSSLDGILTGLLIPLATNGSVVLCRHLDPHALERRVASERVTAVRLA